MKWCLPLIALLLCGNNRPELAITERVDRIELNHYHDAASGRLVFSQWLFWDFNRCDSQWEIIDWRLLKSRCDYSCTQLPHGWTRLLADHHATLDKIRGQHVLIFWDGELLRKITADFYWQTFSDADPELLNRELLPKADRRKLRRAKP